MMMSTKVMVVLSNMSQMVLPAAFKSIASMSGIPITDLFIFIIQIQLTDFGLSGEKGNNTKKGGTPVYANERIFGEEVLQN